jgi:2-oxoglutarate dehydrogenase E1 component
MKKSVDFWREFNIHNQGYLLELYRRFRQDPDSVQENYRSLFEQWGAPPDFAELGEYHIGEAGFNRIVGAVNLAQSIRSRGYLAARLDPLGTSPPGDPALSLEFHGISVADLRDLPASLIDGPVSSQADNAWQAIQALQEIYSSATGFDYGHIRHPEERSWLREVAESGCYREPAVSIDHQNLLERLTEVEVFEHYLHRIFPGKTRFSIEGLDMMVPMLDEIVTGAAQEEICMIFLGMAHRGRLNVMAHVLGKQYTQLLAEFRDPLNNFPTWDEMGWTGDVKYHKGAKHEVEQTETIELIIRMPANPSHLEHINPVIAGMARSADSGVDQAGPPAFFPKAALPVMIHGDASFTGEGVVAEYLNLKQLPGYGIGGSLHIIADNQLGFTAEKHELRSSQFASDPAKGYEVPVIHVNADNPEACLEAARISFAYRLRFEKDFVINLIGYRRYGHNEGDEPAFTQPIMYETIKDHPSVRAIWGGKLVERGIVPSSLPDKLYQDGMQKLQDINQGLAAEAELEEPYPKPPPPGAAQSVDTGVPLDQLQALNEALLQFPENFNINKKLLKAMQRRREVFDQPDKRGVDWATAEELALASILQDGIPIRFTGQDVVRGTFSQRHATFYDTQQAGVTYTPLQDIPQARASFEIHNSPLTENAILGFEFGYNIQSPERLVIWEAQYGDFVNLAQIMVDEFIVSARAKWGQTPSIVMLLPHGNEGQGPDHSSARPERFLQLAADTNLRLAYPTTAGQYFHLLRRQATLLQTDPLPLIIFTPKSLLRHPQISVPPQMLADGAWQPLIEDPLSHTNSDEIRRLILCSGKIYVDLVSSEYRQNEKDKASKDVAIVRIEQLYPFPENNLGRVLGRYTSLEEVDWVQEEPQNMGSWNFIRSYLDKLIAGRWPLHYIGRPPSSSPAEGSTNWYKITQKKLIENAFIHGSTVELIGSDVIKERG